MGKINMEYIKGHICALIFLFSPLLLMHRWTTFSQGILEGDHQDDGTVEGQALWAIFGWTEDISLVEVKKWKQSRREDDCCKYDEMSCGVHFCLIWEGGIHTNRISQKQLKFVKVKDLKSSEFSILMETWQGEITWHFMVFSSNWKAQWNHV